LDNPILLDEKHILPPAALLVEGYGEVRTNAYIMHLPSGYVLKTQCDLGLEN
jgi:hypothetical protein